MTCGSGSIDGHPRSALSRRLPSQLGSRAALALAALWLSAGCERAEVGKPLPAVGAELTRDLAAAETHRYHVDLGAGEYLHAVVEQRGIDSIVAFFDPSGQQLFEVDSPNATEGPEHLWTIVDRPGRYLLELHAVSGSGAYVLRTLAQRVPQGTDADFAAAARALAEGEKFRQEGGKEAFDQALERYQFALGLLQRLGEPLQEAITWTDIGRTWIASGDPGQAIRSYEQARRRLRDAPGIHSHQTVALLNWLGSAHRMNLAPSAARATFGEALEIARESGDRLGKATALSNIARISGLRGQAQEALKLYEEALSLWRQLGENRRSVLALIEIGYNYMLLGKSDEAREFLEEAVNVSREARYHREETRALTQLGWVHYLQDELTEAFDHYSKALDLTDVTKNLWDKATILDRQGTAYFRLERLAEARVCHERAAELFEELGDTISAAHVQSNLSRLHAHLGDLGQALQYFESAIERFEASEDRHGEAHALFTGAQIERRRGNFDRARLYLERTLAIVESNRNASVNHDWRISYLESHHGYYDLYIDLLMELSVRESSPEYAELALAAAERTRARGLLDLLHEAGADIRRGVDESLLQRESALRERLSAKGFERFAARRNASPPQLLERIDRELAQLTRESQRLQAEIRTASPGYAALTQLEPLDLPQIQGLLDEETLLLAYALGRERSFLWAVSAESVQSYQLARRSVIEATAKDLHGYLSRSDRSGPRMQARQAAAALSKMVLEPVGGQLRRRLLVVSAGALHYIPFAALPSSGFDSDPLLVDHEIIHLPSVSVLGALRREAVGRPPAERRIAVLADPVFATDDSRLTNPASGEPVVDPAVVAALADVRRSARDLGLPELIRLPHSRREAEAILALAPDDGNNLAALDFAASRALATSAELGRYRFVHFATHGILHAKHPELSGIVLAMVDERGRAVNGLLRAHEIYPLRLAADLVVLSACQTALGKEVRGEGILGLTRGFMHAGVPRVVVSLWKISDRATAELMTRFYQGVLVEGRPPAAALREAQRSLLEQERWRAPYYWASFVLQGEWR